MARPAMEDAFLAWSAVAYTAMVGEAGLTALIAKNAADPSNNTPAVLSEVTKNQPFPYVTIGQFESVPFRTHSRPGEELEWHVGIYTQDDDAASGDTVGLTISEEVKKLFGDVRHDAYSVTGFDFIASWYDRMDIVKEEDDAGVVTRHFDVAFRIRMLQDTT